MPKKLTLPIPDPTVTVTLTLQQHTSKPTIVPRWPVTGVMQKAIEMLYLDLQPQELGAKVGITKSQQCQLQVAQ